MFCVEVKIPILDASKLKNATMDENKNLKKKKKILAGPDAVNL